MNAIMYNAQETSTDYLFEVCRAPVNGQCKHPEPKGGLRPDHESYTWAKDAMTKKAALRELVLLEEHRETQAKGQPIDLGEKGMSLDAVKASLG